MWNDSYRDYVKQLVMTNRKEYPYYVAHTCTYWGINNTGSLPAFKVYFSSDPIISEDEYTFILSDNSLVYYVIGSNANSNYHDQRVTIHYDSGRISIKDYEFIYSNAECAGSTIQPDLLATTEVTQSHFDSLSLILLVVLLATVVVRLLKR